MKNEFFDLLKHCKAVGRQARIKFNLTPKSRKGTEIMKYLNQTAALMQIQMVQMVMLQHGFHTMLTTPSDDSTQVIEFSVFFNDEEELHTQNILLMNLIRKEEEIEIHNHTNAELKGGWIDYNVEF